MSVTLVYVGIGSVLAVSVAILTVAILFLRTAQRYVDLAEKRLELLREGQVLLLRLVQQQSHASRESRQREPERSERIPEVVGHSLGQQRDEKSPGSLQQPEELDRPAPEAQGLRGQVTFGETGQRRRERTPKAGAQEGVASRPKEGAPPLGVKLPHQDDYVTSRVWNNSATKFFQKKYDLYLEHYEGYIRLAERLHQMRDEAEANSGTLEVQEWEEKLRRAYDAIERTTQRLDVLEQHYPELATDSDRLSARIGIARSQAGLEERFGLSR